MEKDLIKRKIAILHQLANQLSQNNLETNEIYLYAKAKNPWFSLDFIIASFNNIIDEYFNESKLEKWLEHYDLSELKPKTIGIIVAGNIPLVGIHDIICAYFTPHKILLKLSSKDDVLMNYIIEEWSKIDSEFVNQFSLSENLKNIDAIIATGSNTTHNYFEFYFNSIPKILRKNRNSIAILDGSETDEELYKLADDVFMYFGLGCRNVSCIFIPKTYEITRLFSHFDKYSYMKNHVKYMNNYDYNRTLLLMNQLPHLANDYLILEEKRILTSRLATLHYSYYEHINEMNQFIEENQDQIQCVVSKNKELKTTVIPFGESQKPNLNQYSDNIDTLQFLINL